MVLLIGIQYDFFNSGIGKFLLHYEDYCIERVQDKPDAIIKNDSELIGLEHEVIVDRSFKNIEGYFENIARQVKKLFVQNTHSDFLANIYFNTTYPVKTKEKSENAQLTYKIIESCLESN